MAHINDDDYCLDDLDDEVLDDNMVVQTSGNLMFKFSDQDNLDNICKLQKSEYYMEIMNKVEDALLLHKNNNRTLDLGEDDPEYQLVFDCNALLVSIENEIVIVHNFIRDIYRSKFPELDSLVPHPIDYATVVKKIGNVTDLTLVDLHEVLPTTTIMVLSITASTTSGKPLQEESLKKAIEACNLVIALDLAKKKVLDFVETRMGCIAPNLSAIVGSIVAAKLLGIVGGLSAFETIPSCDVQLLGAKKKSLADKISPATPKILHVGFFEETEIFQTTPPSLRKLVCGILADKSTLAARVDSRRRYVTGEYGRTLRDEIRKKIEKLQELPPARQPKPLPVPNFNTKKKRGGRRFRKTKERYAVTEMRKLANRVQFGVPEESSLGDGLGVGYGLLGQSGSGKLRLPIGQNRRRGVKGTKKFNDKHFRVSSGSSGLTSSLVFTPMQGIELINPLAHSDMQAKPNKSVGCLFGSL